MSATAGVLVLGFLFCAFLAWKCVELIREAAPRDESERDPDAPIRACQACNRTHEGCIMTLLRHTAFDALEIVCIGLFIAGVLCVGLVIGG